EVEFRLLPVERRAVADEQHEQLIVLRQPLAEIAEGPLHVLARRLRDARLLVLGEDDDAILRVPELLAHRRHERRAPFVVLLCVCVAARRARDDERVVIAGKTGGICDQQAEESSACGHASTRAQSAKRARHQRAGAALSSDAWGWGPTRV